MEPLRETPPHADEALLEVLRETDLNSFATKLCVDLQLTRLEHFDHIEDSELESSGLSVPAIRRLRAAIDEKRKRSNKLRNFFKGKDRLTASFRTSTDRKNSSEGESGSHQDIQKHKKKKRHGKEEKGGEGGKEEGGVTCLIASDHIKLMEKIGEGSFAVVRRAVWQAGGGKKDVAVKLLRDSALSEELQQEVDHMHHLRHPNLIRLHGLVFARPIMMVVELCDGGALLDRLRNADKQVLLASQLMHFALQISKGMAYLEDKRFIHRDLAARNVLLNADEKVVKIGDFGLMRALPEKDEHYVMSGQKKVPFAWCPPESLKRRQFSHASDVWSFAVTLWEMFTFGEEPWCGFRGPEILQKVQAGERLVKPTNCPSSLYKRMLECWAIEPENRPRFADLKIILKQEQLATGTSKEEQKEEGLLYLVTGDHIVVIDGCPEQYYWFGQNQRTRMFGKFPRKIFKPHGSSKQEKDISMPIKGSFIHAGHGDARGGESWGNPDKIDPIILGNPMPEAVLIELGTPSPTENRKTGAETITSIMNLGEAGPIGRRHQSESQFNVGKTTNPDGQQRPWSEQFGATQGSSAGSSGPSNIVPQDEVDPFAPFPYDDLGSTLYGSVSGEDPSASTAVYDSVPQDSYTQLPYDSGYDTQNSSAMPEFSSRTTRPTGAHYYSPPVTSSTPSPRKPDTSTPVRGPLQNKSASIDPSAATVISVPITCSPSYAASSMNQQFSSSQLSTSHQSTPKAGITFTSPASHDPESKLPIFSHPPQATNDPLNLSIATARVSPERNTPPAAASARISPPKLPRLPAPLPVPKRTSTLSVGSLGAQTSSPHNASPSATNHSPNQSTVHSARVPSEQQINFRQKETTFPANPSVPVSVAITSNGAEPDPFEISQTTMEMLKRPRYNQFYQPGNHQSVTSSSSMSSRAVSERSLNPGHVPHNGPSSHMPTQMTVSHTQAAQSNPTTELRPHSQPGTLTKNEETQHMVEQLSSRLSQMSARMESISPSSTLGSTISHKNPSGPVYTSNSVPRMPLQAFTTTGLTTGFNTISQSQPRSRPASFVGHQSSAFPTSPGVVLGNTESRVFRSSTPTGQAEGAFSAAGQSSYSQRSAMTQQHILPNPNLANQIRASSVPDVTPAVLDLFDPLTSRAPTNLVQEVQRAAPFVADSERCSTILRRCGMDVEAAVKELKVQKLMDTGIAGDRDKAISALDHYSWDVNAAAEALLG